MRREHSISVNIQQSCGAATELSPRRGFVLSVKTWLTKDYQDMVDTFSSDFQFVTPEQHRGAAAGVQVDFAQRQVTKGDG